MTKTGGERRTNVFGRSDFILWRTMSSITHIVLLGAAVILVITSSAQDCDPTLQFNCEDGECISEDKTCDGLNDCGGSDDELQCNVYETISVTSSRDFTSVYYPSNYISNQHQETIFSTSEDSRLLLTLDFIDVQLHFDQFLIGNGNVPFLEPLLIWSGGPVVDSIKILSSGNFLWLVFITDSSITRKGFSGTIEPVGNFNNGIDCEDEFDCENGVCIPQELVCDFQIHCANYVDEEFCFGQPVTSGASSSTHLSTYKGTEKEETSTTDTPSTTSAVSTASTISTETPSQGNSGEETSTSGISASAHLSTQKTTKRGAIPTTAASSKVSTISTLSTVSTVSTVSTISTMAPSQTNSVRYVDGCSSPGPLPANLFVEPKANEYGEGISIRYYCGDGSIISGDTMALCLNGKWIPPSFPLCEGFDEIETKLAAITDVLSRQNVTAEDIERAADTIEKATESNQFLKSESNALELIAVSLESVVGAGNPSLEVTNPVVKTINNLMNINESVLQKGETKTGRFVAALEKQISNLQRVEGNYSQVLENLAVSAGKVNSSKVQEKLGFAVFSNTDHDPTLLEEDRREANIQTFLDREGFPVRETIVSISLPKAAVGLLAEADQVNRQGVPVSFFVYKNPKLFNPTKTSESSEMDLRSVVNEYIGSRIISARVEYESIQNTTLPPQSPVVIKFKTDSIQVAHDTIADRECVFWNYDRKTQEGYWSNDGCLKMPDEFDLTVCSCNRFANFAILTRIRLRRAFTTTVPLHYVTLIGCIVSGTCLALCIITLLSFKELRSRQSTYIHVNMCVSLLGFYAAVLPNIFTDAIKPVPCAMMSATIQFFTLFALSWISVEAVNILIMLVKLRKTNISYFMAIACIFGYGCPVVSVVLVALFDVTSDYGNTSFCFIQPGHALYFGFLGEVLSLFLFNIIVFTIVTCKMVCSRPNMSQPCDYTRFNECLVRVQHGALFWFLFLVSWIFAVLSVTDRGKQIYEILYCTVVTLQGLATFILLCFANPTVRQLYTKVRTEKPQNVQEIQRVTLSPRDSSSNEIMVEELDTNMNDLNS